MGLSRSRTVTLIVALATLTSNILSSVLFNQLPDDPYHLAVNFGWYLHFANVLSVFGFLGALRQHALSIAIFSNYLLLDTLLCAIPRFLLLGLLRPLSSTLCAVPAPPYTYSQSSIQQPTIPQHNNQNQTPQTTPASQWEVLTAGWTPQGCERIVILLQLTLAAGVLAATVLQFVGALCVREYARALWGRELLEMDSMGSLVIEEVVEIDDRDGEKMC